MRVKTFICGANFTQLGLPVFAPQDVLVKGVFSNIYHNIVPRVNGFAHIFYHLPKTVPIHLLKLNTHKASKK